MFTKKRIIQFCLVAVIFIAADIWMYNTLTNSFVSYVEERNYNEVGLFVQTAPEDDAEIPIWLQSVSSIIPDSQAMYFDYDMNRFTFVPTAGGSAVAENLWNSYGQTAEFTNALDSAYYLEAMQLPTRYPSIINNDQTTVRVFFAPIIAENGYEANGAVMILVPTSGASGYARLLGIFAIGAAVAFIAIAWVIMFTRDPVTGFMVLGLFIIVGIFVAFPLFEALRLSFFRNNQFSLDRWKTGLSSFIAFSKASSVSSGYPVR